MRLTLELTEEQADVFKDILEDTLRVASLQESVINDAIEKEEDNTSFTNMNNFVTKVASQRLLCVEILQTMEKVDKSHRIILPS
jgi:hypothetical protein